MGLEGEQVWRRCIKARISSELSSSPRKSISQGCSIQNRKRRVCCGSSHEAAQQAQLADPRPWEGTHALLIKALSSHEHLHILAEGEGPVVLAEAVQQLGILVVRVLITNWKEERRRSVYVGQTEALHTGSAARCPYVLLWETCCVPLYSSWTVLLSQHLSLPSPNQTCAASGRGQPYGKALGTD